MLSHQWLTTEGVFGVALGVSVSYIFIYVLFGALLDRAGAGRLHDAGVVRVARSPPRRAGESRGRVVGPERLDLRVLGVQRRVGGIHHSADEEGGYSGVKARAIETASSVNGQIMPPVMGAAAFLMVEYVGIPYTEIVKHAFLPAVIRTSRSSTSCISRRSSWG